MLNTLVVICCRKHQKGRKIILEGRKVKLRRIGDILNVSEESVFTILHENLPFEKALSEMRAAFDNTMLKT